MEQLSPEDLNALEDWLRTGLRFLERMRTVARPVPAGAEPPKDRFGHGRPAKNRPTTVPCQTPDCTTVLAVGARGKLPQFCRACLGKRGRRPAAPRETPLRARIGAMAAAAAAPQSMLLRRFDERRERRKA